MPGQDERFDPTEFMTEAQLAEYNEAETRRQRECRSLAEEARGLAQQIEDLEAAKKPAPDDLNVTDVQQIIAELPVQARAQVELYAGVLRRFIQANPQIAAIAIALVTTEMEQEGKPE